MLDGDTLPTNHLTTPPPPSSSSKVMLDGDTDEMLAAFLATAATIPGNAPEGMGLRQGLETTVERWVKARADIQAKASKQLVTAAKEGIAAVVDQRNSVGGAGGPEDEGLRAFDRICLYAQVPRFASTIL